MSSYVVSENPKDWIFAVHEFEGECTIAVTEEKYFREKGYMYDQHVPFDLPAGLSESAEGVYELDEITWKEAVAILTEFGMRPFEDFAKGIFPFISGRKLDFV